MTTNTKNPNIWEKLPTLDSDIIELLVREKVAYVGSDSVHSNLNTLIKQERDPLVIAEHLQGEAVMQYEHKESPERTKMINWLLAASEVFTDEAKILSEPKEHVFTVNDDDSGAVLAKPYNERKWWNRIVGGALVLSLGFTALYAAMKGPATEHPPVYVPPTIEIAEFPFLHPGKKTAGATNFSVAFPFPLQEADSLEERMSIAGFPILHPERDVYVVQRGDNLNRIAGMFIPEEDNTPGNRHVYALHLALENDISNPNLIIPGQQIVITDFNKDFLRDYITPSLEDKLELPIESVTFDEEKLEPLRANGPSTGLLAIGHDDEIPNAIFNYGEIEPGPILGVDERIVTDLLGIYGVGERVNEYWRENVPVEGTHYGTPEQSTTNPSIVPIETRENADRIRYGDSLENKLESDNIDDLLIRDDEYIPMNNSDSSSYGKPGNLFIGKDNPMQLQYVISMNPHSEYNENLSAHNLAQIIGRGARMSSAYEMSKDGMSKEDIAEALNVTKGTVQRYLKEAEAFAPKNNDSSTTDASEPSSQEYIDA